MQPDLVWPKYCICLIGFRVRLTLLPLRTAKLFIKLTDWVYARHNSKFTRRPCFPEKLTGKGAC
jgi:hypothetical protein